MRKFAEIFAGMVLMGLVAAANAGAILPHAGAVYAMGCDGADWQYGHDSQGMGCRTVDGEPWRYWQPIVDASGTLVIAGGIMTVEGTVCTETECIGISDSMPVASNDGQTALVLRGKELLQIGLRKKAVTGIIEAGGEELGYIIHATSAD